MNRARTSAAVGPPDAGRLPPAERVAALRLARSSGVGPVAYRDLIRRFGTASEALAALPGLAKAAGRKVRTPSRSAAEDELAAIERLGGTLIVSGEHAYPMALAALTSAPIVLTVLGDAGALARPAVAIVGARNASAAGQRFAEDLGQGIAAAGWCVTSGLALGIDRAAHLGALAAAGPASGGTVAVLATGIDNPYPPRNVELATEIATSGRGALISERALGAEPKPQEFPRRNRIIAGLALGAVIVEAAERSGSLSTARLANEAGRVVFAVPGSPLDPRASGPNRLLKQGAVLVTCVDDVLAELDPMARPDPARALPVALPVTLPETDCEDASQAIEAADEEQAPDAADAAGRVAGALGATPVTVDELARRCQLSAQETARILLDLELDGQVQRHAGQRVSAA